MRASTRLAFAAVLAFAFAPHLVAAQGEVSTGNTGKVVQSSDSNNAKPDPQPFTLNLSVKESNGESSFWRRPTA